MSVAATAALASPDGAALGARRKRLVLIATSATSSLIMLDTNIVAVSLSSIARDLRTTFAGIEWVISAYIITFAALLLPAGSLADLHGRRRMTVIGQGVFLAASAVCGLARSAPFLEAARAVQGIGAAILLTSALAIISSTFAGPERQRAYAFWGSCLGVAMTIGPIVGGIVTGFFGWRWAFLINVPICAVLIGLTLFAVPESRDTTARRFDWAGVATLSGGLFCLTRALIDGNRIGWGNITILGGLAAAAVLLPAFVVIEARKADAMLDLRLFRRRQFVGSACAMAGYGAGAQVMIFFLPLYLQGEFGLAPLAAGLAMLPFALPLFVAPRIAASLLAGWSQRAVLVLALGIVVAGDLLLAILASSGSYAIVACAMLVAGIGTGILNPETARAMQNQATADRAGMASGIGATTRFTSLLLGVAILGTVIASVRPATAGAAPLLGSAFTPAAIAAACIALASLVATWQCMGEAAAVPSRR